MLLSESGLIVGRRRLESLQLGIDELTHLPYPFQIGVDVAFALLVEDPLTIEEHFHDALAPRGNSNGSVRTVSSEKLIRHPRGGSEVLSRDAVGDFQLDLSFHVKHSLG